MTEEPEPRLWLRSSEKLALQFYPLSATFLSIVSADHTIKIRLTEIHGVLRVHSIHRIIQSLDILHHIVAWQSLPLQVQNVHALLSRE